MASDRKPYQWLAWFASVALVISSVLAAFNLYPWYSIGFMVANGAWIIVGLLWRENSLVFMNATITLIYIIGLLAG